MLCIIGYIAYANQTDFFRLFSTNRANSIVAFLLLNLLSTLIATFRWKLLFPRHLNIKYKTLLMAFLASHPFKLLGLGFIGSDIYKSLDITNQVNLKKTESIYLTILDRIVSLYALVTLGFIFSCFSILINNPYDNFYKYSALLCFSILLIISIVYLITKYLKNNKIVLLKFTVDLKLIRTISNSTYFKAISIGIINHSVSILSFYILISSFLPSDFSFLHFFPFGVSLFITEVIPVFGAAHFFSTLFFESVGIKNGLFLFNDYFLCLKLFQVILSLTLIPTLLRKRQKNE